MRCRTNRIIFLFTDPATTEKRTETPSFWTSICDPFPARALRYYLDRTASPAPVARNRACPSGRALDERLGPVDDREAERGGEAGAEPDAGEVVVADLAGRDERPQVGRQGRGLDQVDLAVDEVDELVARDAVGHAASVPHRPRAAGARTVRSRSAAVPGPRAPSRDAGTRTARRRTPPARHRRSSARRAAAPSRTAGRTPRRSRPPRAVRSARRRRRAGLSCADRRGRRRSRSRAASPR